MYRALLRNGLIILVPIIVSVILLKTYKENGETIEVVLLQPNINPYTEKYNTSDERIGTLLTSLTEKSASNTTDFIIAPETVFADSNRLTKFSGSIAKKTAQHILKSYPNSNFLSGISLIDVFDDPKRIR